jgi:hypothetical protein
MLRKLALSLLLLIGGSAAFAQVSNPAIILVASAPSGACTINLPDQQVIGAGTLYSCQNLTWGQIGGGGGSMTWPTTPGITVCTGTPCAEWGTSLAAPSGTIVGTTDTQTLTNKSISGDQITSAVANATTAVNFSGSLSGDVTGTQSATVVGKINGVALSGLATGPLYNTTATGIPSIETAAQAISALGSTPAINASAMTNFPTFNQSTTGSAASLSVAGQSGLLTFTGITSTNRILTVRDAADTILELGGSYTPTGTWTWTSCSSCVWPTFNQNTTGTSGGLSGSPAITVSSCTGCGGGTPAYPLTITGGVSGGVVYGNDSTHLTVSPAGTVNVLMKWGGAATSPQNSSITDNGTTVTSTDTGGYVAPVFVANGTTAGFMDFPQGSTSAAVAPCNTANSICWQAPASVTSQFRVMAGAPASGFSLWTNSSGTMTETISGVDGTISAGPALFGSSAVNTVVAQTVAAYAGHFTNLVITSSLGGTCTTAPTFNVFDGTTNTGTAKLATATTQTKGTATSQTQTQTFAAGDLIGIYISIAGATCTTDTWAVSAEYSIP